MLTITGALARSSQLDEYSVSLLGVVTARDR
jgi:hypothetical protein